MSDGETEQKSSRMAELAVELLGARMAHEFLTTAWENASLEAKQQLADALVTCVRRQLDSGNQWTVESTVNGILRELITEHMQTRREELAAAVREEVEKRWSKAVVDVATHVLQEALRETKSRIGRAY